MAETNIGYAVLQIIPSLKGVSEAIEKQSAGQVVEVKIEPKTDAAKVDKSIKDAVKKKPVEVPITPKVDQKQLDQELQAAKDKILKGAKDWDSFNKANAEKWAKIRADEAKAAAEAQGKNISKVITEASKKARDTKIEMPQIDTGQVKKQAEGVGKVLRDTLNQAIKDGAADLGMTTGELQAAIGEKVGGYIGQKIGDAIRESPVGKAITDAVETAQPAFDHIRDAIDSIRAHDAAGSITGISDALRAVGQGGAADALQPIATKAGEVQTNFNNLRGGIQDSTTQLLTLTNNSGRIAGGLSAISAAAGPLAAVFAGLQLMPGFMGSMNSVLAQIQGQAPFDANAWLHTMTPGLGALDQIGTQVTAPFRGPTGVVSPIPRAPMSPGGGDFLPSLIPSIINPKPMSPEPIPGVAAQPGPVTPTNPIPIPVPVMPVPVPVPNPTMPSLGGLAPPTLPGRAGGGKILGAGSGVSDSILARVSNGEYIVNADATRKNLSLLEVINSGKLPGFEGGGLVTVDALKKYAQGISGGHYVLGGPPGLNNTDCSGAQAGISNFITGSTGRFATATEAGALAARGFHTGDPPPGVAAYWIGWMNGGPGGGHTAGTIVDPVGGNVNVEMGGASGGGSYGGGAGGAKGFPNRAWLQILAANANGGELPLINGKADGSAGAAPAAAAGTGGSGGGGGFSLPTSFGDIAGFGLKDLGAGVGTTKGGSDLSLFGNAAASAVSGQVSSALGAFGIPGAPHWLGGISQLVGGISVGGSGGGGFGGATPASTAIPSAASWTPAPAALPDGVHGGAGQQPGAQTVFNIQTDRVQDAFIQADRRSKEKAMAKVAWA